MLKYKLNPNLLVNIVESKQKKKIDNYVSFALEDADDNASMRNEILEIEHVPEYIEKFFKKLDKSLKYEFIFRVFDDYSVKKNSKEKDFVKFMKIYSKEEKC